MKALTRGLALLLAAGLALAVPSVDIQLPGYDLYYVGDLDPRGDLGGVADEILVTLTINEPGTYDMSVELSFGNDWLTRGKVRGFNVQPGIYGPWSLTQIRNSSQLGLWTGRDGEFNEDFLDRVSGNALPTGVYTVTASFELPPNMPVVRRTFTITDPRRIDLQLPADGLPVFNDQPTFSWSGRASEYAIRVCPYDPELHSSPLEAIEGVPDWEAELRQTSVVYGSVGIGTPLVPGQSYAWVVEAILKTTSGIRHFPSAVRTFTVAGGNGGDDELLSLFGGLTPSQLAGIAHLLEGLRLDGPISIDGEQASVGEFAAFLGRFGSGELNFASIHLD